MESKKFFATTNLWLAGFLLCRGHEILGTEDKKTMLRLVFENSPVSSGDIGDYGADGKVPARAFSKKMIGLREILDKWREEKR